MSHFLNSMQGSHFMESEMQLKYIKQDFEFYCNHWVQTR
jgi:hypothetical protein